MKEATGELSTTVITVIAIAAVAGLFYAFVWPSIQRSIVNRTCETMGNGYHAVNATANPDTSKCIDADSSANKDAGEGADSKHWWCCDSSITG